MYESLKLFSQKGFLETSVEEILSQSKCSKGGLYNHFRSKDEIFHAVLSQARKVWRDKVLHGVSRTQDPLQNIRTILKNYQDRYLKDTKELPGGCVFVSLSVELDGVRPDFTKEIVEGFSRTQRMLKSLLDQAQRDGALRPDVNTHKVSSVLFSGMLGSSVLWGADRSPEHLETSIEGLIDYLDSLSNPC